MSATRPVYLRPRKDYFQNSAVLMTIEVEHDFETLEIRSLIPGYGTHGYFED